MTSTSWWERAARPSPADHSGLRAWLAARSDDQLQALFRRRPDLAVPAPADLGTLAARIMVRTSVHRAVDRLDGFTLRVLTAAARDRALSSGELAQRLPDAPASRVAAAVADLVSLALVRLDPQTGAIVPVAPVSAALDTSVPAGGPLTEGSGQPASAPAPADPPHLSPASRSRDLDALGTTAVLELLRWVDGLAQLWAQTPPPVLRSGGLGVRELRRSAKSLRLSEGDAALVVEVAAFAGLVGPGGGPSSVFLPTTAYDGWAARDPASRWIRLARAWLTMPRRPDLVGSRDDRDKVITALGFEIERSTAPDVRTETLTVLTALPDNTAARDEATVLARLQWHAPRQAQRTRDASAAALREAEIMGMTAAGGLTSYGRAALAAVDDPATARSWGDAETRLRAALPDPVDTVMVQPDLTVVVPGQPAAGLGRELALLADLESAGGAAVYRISETSLRRAFDAGRTAPDLLEFLTARSSTPIPQALRYVVDDLGRRYGALRAGAANSYVRCDDVDLLTRVMEDKAVTALNLRRLAPTVAVSTASPAELLKVLRNSGLAPAAESTPGESLSLDVEPPRAPARRGTSRYRSYRLTDAQLRDAVARLRSGEQLSQLNVTQNATVSDQFHGITSATMLGTIREAIRAESPLWLGYADESGATSARVMVPISMAGGHVRGYGVEGAELESLLLHRIIAARPLARDDPFD